MTRKKLCQAGEGKVRKQKCLINQSGILQAVNWTRGQFEIFLECINILHHLNQTHSGSNLGPSPLASSSSLAGNRKIKLSICQELHSIGNFPDGEVDTITSSKLVSATSIFDLPINNPILRELTCKWCLAPRRLKNPLFRRASKGPPQTIKLILKL